MDMERVKQADYVDVVLRIVDGCGVLPILTADGEEIFRGEYQSNAEEALSRVRANFPDIEDLF